MRQLGGRLDFALEALDGVGICSMTRAGSSLSATIALHPPMLGLEDLPHAAGADPIEDHVVAQHQRLGLTTEHLRGLELGQLADPDKASGQFLGADARIALGGHFGGQCARLFLGEQTRCRQGSEEFFTSHCDSPPNGVRCHPRRR